jgi:hypothetical protein
MITHRITGFLDFFHRPVFCKIENTTFRKLNLFPSSGEMRSHRPVFYKIENTTFRKLDLFPSSGEVCSLYTRYTQLRERHTQWDTKTAAIYKIGRKSSYKIILQHQNWKKVIITTMTCLNEYYLTMCTVQYTPLKDVLPEDGPTWLKHVA